MKLPIIKELKISNNTVDFLTFMLKKNRIGRTPLYIDLLTYDYNKTVKILKHLRIAISKIGVNPRFPYPLYIITDKLCHYYNLPLVTNKKNLFSYYIKQGRNLNRREILILSKLYILLEKINNNNVTKEHSFIKTQSKKRRFLKDISYESSLYYKIIKDNTPK